jgi:hypothetical protein
VQTGPTIVKRWPKRRHTRQVLAALDVITLATSA